LSFLNEDRGAKSVIKDNLEDVNSVNADVRAVDVDSMDDYDSLFIKYGS